MELYIFWALWICGVLAIISFNYALLKYYTDPHETVKLTLFIQVVAFSSVMIYILLIPFDVFTAVRHLSDVITFHDPVFQKSRHVKIYDLYFTSYLVLIFLSFVGLPFSYFYAQTVQEEEDQQMAEQAEYSMSQSYTNLGTNGMDSSETSSEDDEDADPEIDLGAQD